MELWSLNSDFTAVKVIDDYESAIWTDRYNEYGDFELYLPMSESVNAYISDGKYLSCNNSEHVMIVEQREIQSDSDNGDHFIASGRSLESILTRRIVWEQTVFENTPFQSAIKKLLDENIISPTIGARKIDNFIFSESDDSLLKSLTITAQYRGEELYEIISKLCKNNGIGFKIVLNSDNQFVFSLYVGENRSYSQTENPYVIFSPGFENIITSDYVSSSMNYKNVALVVGEETKSATYGTASGLSRREIFVDAGDLSMNTDSETLTEEEYLKQLSQRGSEELTDYQVEKQFDGEAETTKMFTYGTHFFIGDIVQVANGYGQEEEARVNEMIFSQDEDGFSVYPTFAVID